MGQQHHVENPGTFHVVALPRYQALTLSSRFCQQEGQKEPVLSHIAALSFRKGSECFTFSHEPSSSSGFLWPSESEENGSPHVGNSSHSLPQRNYLGWTWMNGQDLIGGDSGDARLRNRINKNSTVWEHLTSLRDDWVKHEGNASVWDKELELSGMSSKEPEALFSLLGYFSRETGCSFKAPGISVTWKGRKLNLGSHRAAEPVWTGL